jgi:hypothetical protein
MSTLSGAGCCTCCSGGGAATLPGHTLRPLDREIQLDTAGDVAAGRQIALLPRAPGRCCHHLNIPHGLKPPENTDFLHVQVTWRLADNSRSFLAHLGAPLAAILPADAADAAYIVARTDNALCQVTAVHDRLHSLPVSTCPVVSAGVGTNRQLVSQLLRSLVSPQGCLAEVALYVRTSHHALCCGPRERHACLSAVD